MCVCVFRVWCKNLFLSSCPFRKGSLTSQCITFIQWHFLLYSNVLHYIHSADKSLFFRIFYFCTLYHSPSPDYALFLTACPVTPPSFLLCPPHCCSIPQLLKLFLCPVFPFSCHCFISLSLSPLASFLPVLCFCVCRLMLQRVVKTPSAVHAAPVCPASTGTPKRLSPHCSSASPMRARVTLCPHHVFGWVPA